MQSVDAFEVKTHFSALLEKVEHGEQIIITKYGHPVARLVPIEVATDLAMIRQTVQRLKEFGKMNTLGALNLKDLRDEGRH